MRSEAAVLAPREAQVLLAMWVAVAACGGSSSGPSASVATIEVTPSSVSRQVGQAIQLNAIVKDAGGNTLTGHAIAWSTNAPSVASVSSSGLVTANTVGTAVITAESGSKKGYASITVIPEPIASITVSPSIDTLLPGETVLLTATLRDANSNIVTGRNVSWRSADASIASVSGTGLVTAVGDGLVSITASADNQSASATIRAFGRCAPYLAPAIAVNQTHTGTLATTDCRMKDCNLCGFLSDSSYVDLHGITVTAATSVQIDMIASYDTYLELRDFANGVLNILAANNDADPDDPADPSDPVDKNARLRFTLLPGKSYFILANAFLPNVTGTYQLKVTATALQKLGER